MRIKVINKSSRPDSEIVPLCRYAASFFPHRTGTVPITVKNSRRGPHGKCYSGSRCTVWVERPGHEQKYPCTFEQMHYFRHANHEAVKTLTAETWQEYFLNVVAHELEHTTKGNRLMRRSRQEIHAWNRGVSVVEASRNMSADEWTLFYSQKEELEEAVARQQQKAILKSSPEFKRQHCEELMAKWVRKQKLAVTKIRKLKQRIKYFERREAIAASH